MPAIPGGSRQQLATHDRDGLARERYTVAAYFHLDQTAAGGGLPRRERGPTETASPMGTEAAVRRSGHRILVDAGTRGEVARHEVDAVGLGFGRAPPSLCRGSQPLLYCCPTADSHNRGIHLKVAVQLSKKRDHLSL